MIVETYYGKCEGLAGVFYEAGRTTDTPRQMNSNEDFTARVTSNQPTVLAAVRRAAKMLRVSRQYLQLNFSCSVSTSARHAIGA